MMAKQKHGLKKALLLFQNKAIGHLAETTAVAQRDGHTNGKWKQPEILRRIKDKMNNFLMRRAASTHRGIKYDTEKRERQAIYLYKIGGCTCDDVFVKHMWALKLRL